jgi:hypothetical protein
MENTNYFNAMRSQLNLGTDLKFEMDLKEDMDKFLEKNKDLPENEFKKLFDNNYLSLISTYRIGANYKNIKGIYNILIFFFVTSLVSVLLAYLVMNAK